MRERPGSSEDNLRAIHRHIAQLPEKAGAAALEQFYRKGPAYFEDSTPRRAAPPARRSRKKTKVPRALDQGIKAVNDLRRRAMPKATDLPKLDTACGAALTEWWMTVLDLRPQPPTSPTPALSPGEALVIGALLRLEQHPPHADIIDHGVRYAYGSPDVLLLLEPEHAAAVGITGPLRKLLRALQDPASNWRVRIRRCPYRTDAGRACYQFFLDTSPAGNAMACKVSHAVRLNELQGPRRPRKKRPRRRRLG